MERKVFVRDCIFHMALLVLVLVADQLTKWWARTSLPGKPVVVWKDVLSFRLIYNTGASFGIFQGKTLTQRKERGETPFFPDMSSMRRNDPRHFPAFFP